MINEIITFLFKIINITFDKIYSKEEYIIISCQRNKNFYGNSSSLFEYFANQTDLKVFFITKNRKLYQQLSKKFPEKILYAYSIKSLIVFSKSKVLFISHGLGDISPYYLVPNSKKVINLWHSPLLKKIGLSHTNSNTKDLKILISNQDFFVTSSKYEAQFIKDSFNLSNNQIWITGTPRNDKIIEKDSDILEKFPFLKQKVILYAPTFRDDGSSVKFFPFPDLNYTEIENFLEEKDAVILIRGHFNDYAAHGHNNINQSERILSANQDKFPDIQKLLPFVDILITDYSGVYIDFLLLDKPIVFLPYDIEEYANTRGFYYSYNTHTPGPKLQNQAEFIEALNKFLSNDQIYSIERQTIRNKFFDYQDNRACERIHQNTLQLLEE